MIDLNVKHDMKQVERQLDAHKRKHIPKATSRAINKAITKTRTDARRDIAKQMNIPQKRIKDNFFLKKASPSRLIAVFAGKGKPIKLIYFRGTRQLKKGVKSAAYGIKRLYEGTFIANVGAGHKGVFKRRGKQRLPVKELYGPGVPDTMSEKVVQEKMEKVGRITFLKELKRQLDKVLK